MRVAFRVDASIQIGNGHVMRCLTLANALRLRGAHCSFISKPHAGHLLNLVTEHEHSAISLPLSEPIEMQPESRINRHQPDWLSDAEHTRQALTSNDIDWLVADHYSIDHRWENAVRPFCKKLMVIDDLANRSHECDLLLDQNLGRISEDYLALVQSDAKVLVGPKYALLRDEFSYWRQYSLQNRKISNLGNLLVSMGGVDVNNMTEQVLEILRDCKLPSNLKITVILGPHAPWLTQVRRKATEMPWPTEVLINTNQMARLMAESDLSIGGAGTTAWERCALGLPSFVFVLAENQRAGAESLQQHGAAMVLNDVKELKSLLDEWSESNSYSRLNEISAAAAQITDGKGVLRVIHEMLSLND